MDVFHIGSYYAYSYVLGSDSSIKYHFSTKSGSFTQRELSNWDLVLLESLLNYQKYYIASVVEGKFKNEKKMLTTYWHLKDKSKAETQNQSKELSKILGIEVSFTAARNITTNSLNLAIANAEGVW